MTAGRALRAGARAIPLLPEIRLARPGRPLTSRWAQLPVEPGGTAMLGISFRPLQASALGLDPRLALAKLLRYPFGLIRLAAYWDQLEPAAGRFEPAVLDEQLEAAARAGKKIIVCVGAVKAFGYPEFFVPGHRLPEPLPEGRLIGPPEHQGLLEGACGFIARLVHRYRDNPSVVAWQVEHEGTDPLGMEHSWRLSAEFVRQEVAAVRRADPSRPVLLTGFLPTSAPVRLQQRWRTRDQGDSLALAAHDADLVGLDYYPRHGLARLGPLTTYLAGSESRGQWRANTRFCARAARAGRLLMVAEGQAEPWETETTPPSEPGRGMFSCLPEHVIGTYNSAMRLGRAAGCDWWAYLFWGAEYWLLRDQQGDDRYLGAFSRVLAQRLGR
jgi:hypothetical protein